MLHDTSLIWMFAWQRDGQDGEVTFGLFQFSPPGEDLGWNDCLTYSDQSGFTYSWLHKWAAVSSALAMCLGTLLVLMMLIDCCCNVCCSKFMQTFLVVCCQLNQGFTFLICKYSLTLLLHKYMMQLYSHLHNPLALLGCNFMIL